MQLIFLFDHMVELFDNLVDLLKIESI